MTEEQLLASVMRRILTGPPEEYADVAPYGICIDGQWPIAPEEAAALSRIRTAHHEALRAAERQAKPQ